jgi:hypothetical protein
MKKKLSWILENKNKIDKLLVKLKEKENIHIEMKSEDTGAIITDIM